MLLFTNWGFSEGVSKVYFVFIILAYYTCQTVVDISSSSLGSEMTNDYDERSSLATYKNYFGLTPTVIVGLSLTLSTAFAAVFGPRFGWTGAVGVFMVIWAILMFFLYKNTEGYERPRPEGEEVQGFKPKDIIDLFRNKATRIVMMIFGLGILVNTINYSIQDPYVGYWLEGFDSDWTILPESDLSSVVYTNLPTGTYTFHLAVFDNARTTLLEERTYILKTAPTPSICAGASRKTPDPPIPPFTTSWTM